MAVPVSQGLMNDAPIEKHSVALRSVPAHVRQLAADLGLDPVELAKRIHPESIRRLRTTEAVAVKNEDGTTLHYRNIASPTTRFKAQAERIAGVASSALIGGPGVV